MKKSKEPLIYFYRKNIEIPMYGGYFIIIFSNDVHKVAQMVRASTEEIGMLYGQTFHNFLYKGYEAYCVCYNFWHQVPISMGTIVHEITHTGNKILQARGCDPDWENDEPLAYLNGWMADQIQAFMKKCKIA